MMTSIGWAQSALILEEPDVSSFPIVSADFIALDSANQSLVDIDVTDVTLTEDGIARQILSVSCPPPESVQLLSSVLTIDVSGSMDVSFAGVTNISIAKAAAQAWVKLLPGASECAVNSFANGSYINQDLTENRQRLFDAINGLSASGGTDYSAGLLDKNSGALAIAMRGRYRRIVIFLTDGTSTIDEDAVVTAAQRDGIVVYTVTLGINAPESLKNIAIRTGGLWFEGLVSEREVVQVYRRILWTELGGKPCTITWLSKPGCATTRTIQMTGRRYAITDSLSANFPPVSVPTLQLVPDGVSFGGVSPGSSHDTLITIFARNAPITITGISSADAHFTVDSGVPQPGYVLQPGDSIRLRIRFTATDSSYVFGWFNIESDACIGKRIFVSGGFPGHLPLVRTLKLTVPNGGERYATEEAAAIEWEGVAPGDTVRLDYSIDGGTTWKSITQQTTGLRHDWRIPATPSNRCLARIEQIGGEGRDGEILYTLTGHQKDVVDASFGPSDKVIVTGGSDGTARLWDVKTGSILLTIPVSSIGSIRARLSADGSHILTCGYGQAADLWDASSGALIQRLTGHTALVTDARFSADGTRIITVGNDGTVIIRDQFGVQLGIVTGLALAAMSPDGTTVATVGPGNFANIRRVAGDAILAQLSGHTGSITDINYSQDGRQIVTASADRTARVWDASTGALIQTLTGHTDVVASAHFNFDGGRVVTGSFDNSVRIWDAVSGAVIRTLQGHRSIVHSADFSSDGRFVISGSGDNTAIVWELTPAVIQADTSDAFWEIVAPQMSAADVDMGRVVIGDERDMTITGWICNTGTVAVSLHDLTITGVNAGDFDIVSGPSTRMLLPGDCATVEFRFAPSLTGLRSAVVQIITATDTLQAAIRGEGVEPELLVESSLIDFGRVVIGSRRDTLVEVVLRNVGSRVVSISAVGQQGPDNSQFQILDGSNAFTLLPGERHSMTLSFAPERIGRTSGSISFAHNASGGVTVVQLFGEGYCDSERRVAIGPLTVIEADAGDVVAIPLRILHSDSSTGLQSFRGTLRFNGSLLRPIGTAPAGDTTLLHAVYSDTTLGSTDGNDRLVPIAVDSISTDGEIVRLICIAALGNADSTFLEMDRPDWGMECPVTTVMENAVFRLRGICHEDGLSRLFYSDGSAALKILSANPVCNTLELSYTLIEPGATRISLIDMQGRTVMMLVDADSDPGTYQLQRELRGCASGTYYCVLETPTITFMKAVYVQR